jgi:proteasome alpha subunit
VSMPFYVSPEQVMKDKADYARKAITRIRSGVVIACDAGILFVAPNPSRALRKFSELYDRIAFARSAATTSSRACARQASGTRT